MLFDLFGPLLGPLLIVILVIVVFESCWRKCPPDKLMIVSGFGQTRSVSGKGTFVIPGLQRVDTLALGAVQVQLSTENEILVKRVIATDPLLTASKPCVDDRYRVLPSRDQGTRTRDYP